MLPPHGPRIPARAFTPHVTEKVATLSFIYAMAGLVLGLACALLGVVLFFHGVAGSSGWVVELLHLQITLSDAAPGVVLFVVGLAVVFVTRYDVRIGYPPGRRR
jgi:hypothetical protein